MQHIETNYQQELRKEILRDCFERENIRNLPDIQIISGKDKNYRSRIQLTDGGFNKKESNETVNLSACPIATGEINDYLKNTNQNERPKGRVHIFGDSRIIGNPLIIAEEREKSQFSRETKLQGGFSQKKREKLRLQKNRHFAGRILNQNNRCEINLLGKTREKYPQEDDNHVGARGGEQRVG